MTTPTQDNYNNTQGQTNNNYTQDNLKLATIHARQIQYIIPIIGKVEVEANAPQYFCFLRIHFLATKLKRGK